MTHYTTTHKKQILIIDDEEELLKAMTRLLEDAYNVMSTSNAQAALDIIKKHCKAIDIIFLDINMPDFNLQEFYINLEKNFPSIKSKLIIMTGGIYLKPLQEFVDTLPNLCLMKPFSRSDLIKIIEKHSNQEVL